MKQKKLFPTRPIIVFLAYRVIGLVTLLNRVKGRVPKEIKKLKKPYLVLSNHVGFWDPFFVGYFLPGHTKFVSSDAVFRSPLLRYFLTSGGTIPKKKNIRDTKVIRDIVGVIRQGDSVGIFPEAVRNYDGSSFPMDKSIIKLIRLLNVPVVVCVLKGMNNFNPRWSNHLRKTKVYADFTLMLKQDEIKELSSDEIYERLIKTLVHDEVEYQKQHMIKVKSKYKAEHINYALYSCPECHTVDSFIPEGNNFSCTKCNYDIHINEYNFFERISEGKLHFDNIRDWYQWEEKWLTNHVNEMIESNSKELIFEDTNSQVFHSDESQTMGLIGEANAKLYIDRVQIEFKDGRENIVLNFDEMQTINPQLNEKLEIYYNDKAYRLIGSRKGISALKWEVAANAIWNKMGQTNKLSPYISYS